MSRVELQIGGRPYTVACAPGEEAHIRALGQRVDAKMQTIGANRAPQEVQNMLFAALLLADEMDELTRGAAAAELIVRTAQEERDSFERQRAEQDALIARLRDELGAAQDALEAERSRAAAPAAPAPGSSMSDDLAPALERFADLLENCAERLEQRFPTPYMDGGGTARHEPTEYP